MAICRGCHDRFPYVELSNGFCPECAGTPQAKAAAPLHFRKIDDDSDRPKYAAPPARDADQENILLTTETVVDLPILERHGIVSSEAVVGMNVLKDMLVDIRDLVGGRSGAAQAELARVREALLADLRHQAARKRANMVVAVALSFSDFGARGGSILAVATGTAVTVGEKLPAQ